VTHLCCSADESEDALNPEDEAYMAHLAKLQKKVLCVFALYALAVFARMAVFLKELEVRSLAFRSSHSWHTHR
jgi:hypothetical protein